MGGRSGLLDDPGVSQVQRRGRVPRVRADDRLPGGMRSPLSGARRDPGDADRRGHRSMIDLDDLGAYRRGSIQRECLGRSRTSPSRCRTGWDIGRAATDLPSAEGIESIAVLGMGGSGVSGDVIQAVTEPRLQWPFRTIKSYGPAAGMDRPEHSRVRRLLLGEHRGDPRRPGRGPRAGGASRSRSRRAVLSRISHPITGSLIWRSRRDCSRARRSAISRCHAVGAPSRIDPRPARRRGRGDQGSRSSAERCHRDRQPAAENPAKDLAARILGACRSSMEVMD